MRVSVTVLVLAVVLAKEALVAVLADREGTGTEQEIAGCRRSIKVTW